MNGRSATNPYCNLYANVSDAEYALFCAYARRDKVSKLSLVTQWVRSYVAECLDHDRELGIEPPKIVE